MTQCIIRVLITLAVDPPPHLLRTNGWFALQALSFVESLVHHRSGVQHSGRQKISLVCLLGSTASSTTIRTASVETGWRKFSCGRRPWTLCMYGVECHRLWKVKHAYFFTSKVLGSLSVEYVPNRYHFSKSKKCQHLAWFWWRLRTAKVSKEVTHQAWLWLAGMLKSLSDSIHEPWFELNWIRYGLCFLLN